MAIMEALSIDSISVETRSFFHHFWKKLWYVFWIIFDFIYYILKLICNPPVYHKSYDPYYSEAQLESAEGQPETLSQCMAASHEFMQLAEKGYYGSAYGKYPEQHKY